MNSITIKTGIDLLTTKFKNSPPSCLTKKRLGLLINPASVNSNFESTADLVNKFFPKQLKALFTPQHGYYAAKQDNMIESDDLVHKQLKIPVYSLYGKTRIPSQHMFEKIDTLIVDIQDVGTRVYTFIYTISYCMEVAKKFGKKVLVLDRPNPVSGLSIEGNCLEPEWRSFVGRYPIPMRHGLTIAEFAGYINETANIHCELEVIPMEGWQRSMYYDDTNLPWLAPSPNMPTLSTAIVYPGQVIWEGTNISEGRGTTQPFEIMGAPFIDTEHLLNELGDLPGVYLRPLCFEPTFNKWYGELCHGIQIHVVNRKKYNSYLTSLRILQTIIKLYPKDFQWKLPPYEYEFEKMPIDLILGSQQIRKSLEKGEDLDKLEKSWQNKTMEFEETVKKYYLY